MAKQKQAKPIPVPVAIICFVIAFALMIGFVVYVVGPWGKKEHTDNLGEQSFAEATKDEPTPIPPAEVKELMSEANVGDAVIYGKYEQDGDPEKAEPIEWIVVLKSKKRLYLVSRYCLDCKPYNNTRENVSWEDSDLRKWLNTDFYNTAFNDKEKESILEITESAGGENATTVTDNVTMLTFDDAKSYYQYDSWRACSPTPYAVLNGARTENENCWWWLRDDILDSATMSKYVHFDGSIKDAEFAVDYDAVGVRPAIWVSADAENQADTSN